MERSEFQRRWERAEDRFRRWLEGLPAPISPLTRNLELLRIASEAFPSSPLKENADVQAVLLAGAANVGDVLQGASGTTRFRVLRRAVTDDFSIWYELEDEQGRVVTRTFVD
jgi:hypothetical protein